MFWLFTFRDKAEIKKNKSLLWDFKLYQKILIFQFGYLIMILYMQIEKQKIKKLVNEFTSLTIGEENLGPFKSFFSYI